MSRMSGAGHVINDLIDSHPNEAVAFLCRSSGQLDRKRHRRAEVALAATAVGRQKIQLSSPVFRSDAGNRVPSIQPPPSLHFQHEKGP